ncbi:uncharacterized protein LOC114542721 [Dendronephthya gigantea]|uniref:uncharacterized protein LOC114542721 n=1 Tax=Dendronephthya gigantea TaxID=151771 RepID=UPI00106CE7BA|nr:uncharacterized protein LOC114542721 [Dendronephthya gigantea]
MKRHRHTNERRWECRLCNCFQAISLRTLLNHYNKVHGNEPNFQVVCGIENCPATFTKYNSLYKHITRSHKEVYDGNIEDNADAEFNNEDNIDDIDHHFTVESDESSSAEELELEMNIDENQNVDNIDITKSAASFLLKVKERNKIPQVAMESIMDSTRTLVKQVVDSVKAEVLNVLDSKTEALQSKYIKQNFSYVEPKEVTLGKKFVWKINSGKRLISEKSEKFVYIPILESIKQILSNKRISTILLKKPKCCQDGVLYDVHDGLLYQSDHYFDEHENTLCIVLYHDELEVCNPLGSNAGVHKLDMYYFTIANLCPKFRSKCCAVHLFAIANADLVKKYGINTVMQPVIDDLNILYQGCKMEINGVEKVIHGKVLLCAGDTLGQHYLGGFKEGVGVAFQKCRHCQCSFEQMQTDFLEEEFNLRTKENYSEQFDAIEQAPTPIVQKDLRTTYGLTQRSSLCQLPTFDVTQQLPQDIMHTLLEGVVQYEVRLVLLHYLQSGQTSLSEINGAILSHEYGYSEISDKPTPLKDTVFHGEERYKLKYNAAKAGLFLRLLPFFIGPFVDSNGPHYQFLIQLIQIVQLIFSPVIKLENIDYLAELIQQHLTTFKDLFPNCNIIPKQHYLLHIPSTIRMLGPMVRSSCFSFESAHNYFKELARKQNFKNLPLSLAKRHQFNLCSNYGDSNENPSSHPLFSTEREYGVLKKAGAEVCLSLRERFDEHGLLPSIEIVNVYKVSWIKLFGTKFAKSGIIAIDVAGDPALPVFGVIVCIWSILDFTYFDVQLLETLSFDEKHQAYRVSESTEDVTGIYPYDSLVDFNVFHCKKDKENNKYVAVKYDLRDIIEEHIEGRNPLH